MTETEVYCANHPTIATQLRCNRCGKAICSKCAVRTPVGYRCRECIREQQQVFETAKSIDFPIVFVVAAVASLLAVWLLSFLGIFGLLVAPAVGVGVAEVIRRAVRGRRSRYFPVVAVVGGLLGSLPFILRGVIEFVVSLQAGAAIGWGLLGLIWPAVYAFLIVSTSYWRLRGIRV